MNEVTASIEQECERRLNNLYKESHHWLIQSAKKVTKNTEEAEDLVSELYEYLHTKLNVKLFWGKNSYNLFYCSKFLHSRFINKTKKLNRTTYVEEVFPYEMDIPYDTERDLAIQKAHDEVLEEIKQLKLKKGFAPAMIFELYWMSDKTLDEVAKDIGISKSTTFLAVRKIRNYLKQVIENPFANV
jgi:DNA-directed RNA polymerase specialized sigma24 family protein